MVLHLLIPMVTAGTSHPADECQPSSLVPKGIVGVSSSLRDSEDCALRYSLEK